MTFKDKDTPLNATQTCLTHIDTHHGMCAGCHNVYTTLMWDTELICHVEYMGILRFIKSMVPIMSVMPLHVIFLILQRPKTGII